MNLFVLRHGQAEQYASSDERRALTPEGLSRTRDLLLRSVDDLRNVDRILASPYLRAQQTAQLAAELLDLSIESSELLTPNSSLVALSGWLEQQTGKTLLLVSHQPLVSNLLAWLCGESRGHYFMAPGALACLQFEVPARGCADLCWLRQPGESI